MLHGKSGLGIVALATTVIAAVLVAPVSAIALPSSNHGGGTPPSTTARLLATASPSQVPQSIPSVTQQWAGLSRVNDGTGELQNLTRSSNRSLHWAHQSFGVDLDWSNQSLWRVEAQGGTQLVKGQAVALRVWGGGWLRYGHQTFGVDLDLSGASGTPSYEWYVLGGQPGSPLNEGSFALWNSVANDYLITSHQTFGVDLDWYRKTLPPSDGGGGGSAHDRSYTVQNCDNHPVTTNDVFGPSKSIWVNDLTTNTGFVNFGAIQGLPAGSQCVNPNSFRFVPTQGHTYELRVIDYAIPPNCTVNSPTGCRVLDVTFVGDTSGQAVTTPVFS